MKMLKLNWSRQIKGNPPLRMARWPEFRSDLLFESHSAAVAASPLNSQMIGQEL